MLDGILKEHKIKTQSLAPFKQVQILLKDTEAETKNHLWALQSLKHHI